MHTNGQPSQQPMGRVRWQVDGAIATVTIDDQETLNALTEGTIAGLRDALNTLARTEGVRVAVLRGAGRRAFASGMNLKILQTYSPADAQRHFDDLNSALQAVENAPFPVIAMVHGYAIGGGAELAAACDLRIAGSGSRIGVPIGRFGHCPDRSNLRRLLRLMSPAHVKAMIMTDVLYNAEEAHRMGFFNWVVPEAQLEEFTRSVARTISQKSPLGMKVLKQVIAEVLDGCMEPAKDPEQDAITSLWRTQDFQEGVNAFFEKRLPDFKGS